MKNLPLDDDLADYLSQHERLTGETVSSLIRRLMRQPQSVERHVDSPEQPEPASDSSFERESEIEEQEVEIPQISGNRDRNEVKPNYRKTSTRGKRPTFGGKNALESYLEILSELYRKHPQEFDSVLTVRGKKRLYFSTDKTEIMASGSSTFPVKIPGSPWWTISNTSTDQKISIIKEVCDVIQIPEDKRAQLLQRMPLADRSKNIPFPDWIAVDPDEETEESSHQI